MNKRTRKKWLKKHNKYVNPREVWDLSNTISHFVSPRLKILRNTSHGYPVYDEMDTYEKWIAALDKMILAFDTAIKIDGDTDCYYNLANGKFNQQKYEEDKKLVDEGLALFAKWYLYLWD